MSHEILIGIVLREIEHGFLKDDNADAKLLDLLHTVTELVRVYKVVEITASEP